MNAPALYRPLLALASLVLIAFGDRAAAEPPMRAARLAVVSGTVSFSPAGGDDWMRAVVNRPLTNGDRLWSDAGSRAELQVGGAAIRMGADTSMTLLNLDDRIAQVQLSQGTLKLRVRRMGPRQMFEVDTPNLAFAITRPGEYRIDVDPDGDATAVRVKSGRADVYGDGASYAMSAPQGYRFFGTDLSDFERLAARRDDAFDRWSGDRDGRLVGSRSAQYVSGDVVGYEDLDDYGTWRRDAEYGNVWTPNRVAASWTPYRDGHWSWVDPWGWTWVDDAPWGYAVSHYGRWANIQDRWSWVPGPQREQAVYAPALVGFVGGQNNLGASSVVGAIAALIGWFPLAPREVYQPSYTVSRNYFDRVNRSNAVIAPTTITNVYNTTIVNRTTNVTRVVYVNQQVRGAVVAVPAQVFTRSQPVAKAAVVVPKETAASAPAAHVAAVAPEKQSVQGGAPAADARPPARERGREHRFVARTAPPAPPVAFAAQQKELAAKPGRPIEDAQRKDMKPAAPAAAVAAPAVTVVTTAPAPSAAPPATAPAGKSREDRKGNPARNEEGRRDAVKVEAAKAEAAKADEAHAAAAKDATEKADAAKAAAAKADATRAEATKAEAARADAAKAAAAKAEASRADAAKAEAAKADAANAEAHKAAAARAEASRAESAKAEAARADAAKAAAAKAEASRADAAKAEAAKAEAAKAEAARNEAAKAAAAKAEAAKVATAKADTAKAARTGARGERPERDKADKADKADEEKKGEEGSRRRRKPAAEPESPGQKP